MAKLLDAHIAQWISARPREARAWWAYLVRSDPEHRQQWERVAAMQRRLSNEGSKAGSNRRRFDDYIHSILSKRIKAGESAPIFPSFDQAFKSGGFAIDQVNEERDDRNRLIHAHIVVRLADGSVVGKLAARGHLSEEQARTARQYLSIWESAGMAMRVTGSYGEGTGGGSGATMMPQSERAEIARSELRALQRAIGHGRWQLVQRVVVEDETVMAMGFAAYPRFKPRPSARTATRIGMALLKEGLDKAADHFHALKRRRRRYTNATPASRDEAKAARREKPE